MFEELVVPTRHRSKDKGTRQQSASPDGRKRAVSTPSPTRQRTGSQADNTVKAKDWPASLRPYNKEKDVKNRTARSPSASDAVPGREGKRRSRSQSYDRPWRSPSPPGKLSYAGSSGS